jgi:hypothetical protein
VCERCPELKNADILSNLSHISGFLVDELFDVF